MSFGICKGQKKKKKLSILTDQNIENSSMKCFSFLGFQVTKQSKHSQLKNFLTIPFLSQEYLYLKS